MRSGPVFRLHVLDVSPHQLICSKDQLLIKPDKEAFVNQSRVSLTCHFISLKLLRSVRVYRQGVTYLFEATISFLYSLSHISSCIYEPR